MTFEVRIPTRTYYLEEADKGSSAIQDWVNQINKVIETLQDSSALITMCTDITEGNESVSS